MTSQPISSVYKIGILVSIPQGFKQIRLDVGEASLWGVGQMSVLFLPPPWPCATIKLLVSLMSTHLTAHL